ncbi:cytochrome c oxidase assembly factor 1 homolog isoform X2 [Callithrix jacchus]
MSMSPAKMIIYGSVLCTGGFSLAYFIIQKTYSRSLYYQLALEQLQIHPGAQEALGPPVSVHHLKLTGKDNFVDIADAKLKIPVSGSKSEGHLHVHSTRSGPFQRKQSLHLNFSAFWTTDSPDSRTPITLAEPRVMLQVAGFYRHA